MKRMKILLFGLIIVSGFLSCKKGGDSNPLTDVNNLTIGSYITLQEKTNVNIDYANLDNSSVSIKVGEYGSAVSSIDMFVVEGQNTDPASWNLIKNVQFTGDGTVLSASATEIASALGIDKADFSPGSSYTIYNRIHTEDGRTFDITNINSDVESNSGYNMAFRFTIYIVCPFEGNMEGDYEVIEDDWADWSPGDIIHVSDGPGANEINLAALYPNPDYGDPVNPIIVDIDPATGTATVPTVQYGDYGVLISCQGGGYVFSCTGTIDLSLEHFQAGGSYGIFRVVLKKL